MKRVLFFTLLIASIGFWSCEKDDQSSAYFHIENSDGTAVNPELNLPADEVARTFILKSDVAWAIVPVSEAGTWVKFDPDHGEASDFVVVTLNVEENKVLAGRNVQFAFKQGNAEKFTIRLTQDPGVPLSTPVTGFNLLLEANPQQAVTFNWASSTGDNAATLLFSKNSDMSNPLTIASNISDASYTLTNADMQNLQTFIETPANGLKRYYQNELYWNVRIGGALISPTARMIYLSGQRTFTDVRGNESITYKVAVIENQYYKGIWMAQNLKTKKLLNGNDISNPDSSPVMFEAPSDGDYSDYTNNGVMTPLENPGNGYYYSGGGWNQLFGGDNLPPFIPESEGWIMPTWEDWEALWRAVAATPGGTNVILDPEVYGNPEYGAWGLNMSEVGYFDTYPTVGVYQSGYGILTYFMVRNSGWSTKFPYTSSSAIAVKEFNYVPIRFKYIGDDE